MKIAFEKDKAYMEVLKVFRQMIRGEYRDGGWLPSAREMSKRLNVSPGTYVKATKRLVAESIAENYPRKGIYIIPEKYRTRKIGVVIGNGEESPFLCEPGLLSAALRRIDDGFYDLHLIQGSPVSNVTRNALSHYVSGLIWITPPVSAYRVINEMHSNNLFPLVVASNIQPIATREILHKDIPSVNEDYRGMSAKMSEFLIDRDHKSVLYLGNKWFARYSGLESRFSDTGVEFATKDHSKGCSQSKGWLTSLLKKRRVTGLIVEGTARNVESVFEELRGLADVQQPELIVRQFPFLTELRGQYPMVKVIGVADVESGRIGDAAAERLVNHLKTGAPLESADIATYSIKKERI